MKKGAVPTHVQEIKLDGDNETESIWLIHCAPGPKRGYQYQILTEALPDIYQSAIHLPLVRLGAKAFEKLKGQNGITETNRIPSPDTLQADKDLQKWLVPPAVASKPGIASTHYQLLWAAPRVTGGPNQRLWLIMMAGSNIPTTETGRDAKVLEVAVADEESSELPEEYSDLIGISSLQVGTETYRAWAALATVLPKLRQGNQRIATNLVTVNSDLQDIQAKFDQLGYRAFIEDSRATPLLKLLRGLAETLETDLGNLLEFAGMPG